MADINAYANEVLLDFVDEFHRFISTQLESAYGDDWYDLAVARTIPPAYVSRTKEMLRSPMRVVDMGKNDDELYGIEHLWNIIEKHWSGIFAEYFQEKTRTQVYLGEMVELRHNVSHRRKHHYLRRSDLLRFAQNARMLLRCIRSEKESALAQQIDSIAQGSSPWGVGLSGNLPPGDEIVQEFVGRPRELLSLGAWLASATSQQLVLWGYGGAGKTAVAYQFARDAIEAAPAGLHAVIWLSAKRSEYVEGRSQPKKADFTDMPSLVTAFWQSLYGTVPDDPDPAGLLRELRDNPSIVIVDDLDTVLSDVDLSEFLLYDLRQSGTKILYTSRQRVPGIREIDVEGFKGEELRRFISVRAAAHELSVDECLARDEAIFSVTNGYPLFVDDLLRLARLDGMKGALESWSQRKGDAAREYALRRQLESLGEVSSDVLIAAAVAGRPLSNLELIGLVGFTAADVDQAIADLLNWKLINRIAGDGDQRGLFTCNQNTQRLTLRTYASSPRISGFTSALRALTGSTLPPAMYKAIATAISEANWSVQRGAHDEAVSILQEAMVGDLETAPDLWGALGWVYSRRHDPESEARARHAFGRAHQLGSRKEDTYFHWAWLELNAGEAAVSAMVDEESVLGFWLAGARAAEAGLERCETQSLRALAGYARTRAAKTLERLSRFTLAQSEYGQAEAHARAGFHAPSSGRRADLHRCLVLALEGQTKQDEIVRAMENWRDSAAGDDAWRNECERMVPLLPELKALL